MSTQRRQRRMSIADQITVNNPQSKSSHQNYNKLLIQAQNSEDVMEILPVVKIILNKSIQTRSTHQNKLLDKFIKISQFFSTLTQYTSFQVSRDILKHSKVFDIMKHRTLVEKGTFIQDVIILMNGKFGIVDFDEPNKVQTLLKQDQIYKKIIQNSPYCLRQYKRRTKQTPQVHQQTQFHTTKASMMDLTILNSIQTPQKVFNLLALIHGCMYTQTVVTCTQSTILTINGKVFYQNLSQYLKKMKHDKISAFRKFQFFNSVEDQRLTRLVDIFPLITSKKGQFVYKQGTQTQNIYLLIKGSIKITKTADLFKQNPNIFYVNRANKLNQKRLPYADFSSVYNYKPRTKLFQIGITNSISIFGEQQLYSDNKLRQVNAQVSSESATFYVINLKSLQSHLNDIKSFMENLKIILFQQQTKKKIIYRQQKLAQLLMCQNKSSMDYFYLNQNSNAVAPIKLQNSPKKYQINKVNQKISPSKPEKQVKTLGKEAAYNTFNFNKFPLYASVSSRRKKQNNCVEQLTKQQSKILQFVHTLQLNTNNMRSRQQQVKLLPKQENNEQKVQNKRTTRSKSPGTSKFLIDIHNPLFEMSYFLKPKKNREYSKMSQYKTQRPMSSKTRVSRPFSPSPSQEPGFKRPQSAIVDHMRSSSIF